MASDKSRQAANTPEARAKAVATQRLTSDQRRELLARIDHEVELGLSLKAAAKKHGPISDATYYNWRKALGSTPATMLDISAVPRSLQASQEEKLRLRRLNDEPSLQEENAMLRAVLGDMLIERELNLKR